MNINKRKIGKDIGNIIKYIIEKINSWPIVALIIFFCLSCPIKNLLNSAEQIRIGDFQLTVSEIGKSLGIDNVIQEINDLTYDELKVFLIIGGEDANYYEFKPTNIPSPKLSKMFENLQEKGLIKEEVKQQEEKSVFNFRTTPKGEKVHRAILDAIYFNLLEGKVKKN